LLLKNNDLCSIKNSRGMMKRILYLLSAVLFFHAALSCKSDKPNIKRAFYFWKSNQYSLDEKELECINRQQVEKLYVKFFEVEPDTLFGAIPVAKTNLNIWSFQGDGDSAKQQTQIIPTVYLKNEVFSHLSTAGLDSLAGNTLFLINKYYGNQMRADRLGDYNEIQLDCDWTEKTKDNYFYLLRKIKELSKKTISCTLRLYPYKYRDRMGIPPVDKAVLMCYNLISPLASEDANSILSVGELEKYLVKTPEYPLHLDIALPVFSWMQVYQNNRFAGLITPKPHELDSILHPVKPLWFEVTKDREFDRLFLRAGDKVKYEEITAKTLKETIALLKEHVPATDGQTIILFHLDTNNIDQFDHETLNSFFTDFSQ
jgi:hypothetical protein